MATLPIPSTPPPPPSAQPRGGKGERIPDAPLPSFDEAPSDEDKTIAKPRTFPPSASVPHIGSAPPAPGAQSAAAPEPFGAGVWASAPAWASDVGEAVRGRLPLPLRDKVQGYPAAKVLAASTLVAFAFFGVFAAVGGAVYRLAKSGSQSEPERAAAVATESTAAGLASASHDAPAEPKAKAPEAVKAPDEATVLLELADSLLTQRRDAEVPSLLGRLIARRPDLKHDARVKRLFLSTAASNDRRAASDAHALLIGPMGETGAALVYELSIKPDVRDATRTRAQTFLKSGDFERVASLPVYAAAKLRSAKTCEDKHALLEFAGKVGEKEVLAYLRELEQQTSCKPEDMVHCQPCMRSDSRLADTIAKLERSVH